MIILKVLRMVEHLLTGALISLAVVALRALGRSPAWQPAVVQWWHQRLCRLLALDIRVAGTPASAALLVANHISWLDIPVLGAQGQIGFLSKAEVRRWPIIGWMAEVAGTLFIERGANRFNAAIAAVRERIVAGFSVVIFAEGTTSDGGQIRRFLPRLFAVVQAADRDSGARADMGAAAAAVIPLQPVALRYGGERQPDPVAPFIDDAALVPHIWGVLKQPGLKVQVTFLPCVSLDGRDRKTLAETSRSAIAAALQLGAAQPQAASSVAARQAAVP